MNERIFRPSPFDDEEELIFEARRPRKAGPPIRKRAALWIGQPPVGRAAVQPTGAALVLPDPQLPLNKQTELVLFAMNLFAEAGSEVKQFGLDALRAVAHVVLNRMKIKGHTARQVILAPKQFSWTTDSTHVRRALNPVQTSNPKSLQLWNDCLKVAREALGGVMPPVKAAQKATHYLNPAAAKTTTWEDARCFTGRVGHHCFFQLHKAASCRPSSAARVGQDDFCARKSKKLPLSKIEKEILDEFWDEINEELESKVSGDPNVRWLQDALNRALGTSLAIDGKAGPATRAAVRSFQKRHGLPVDGIAGAKTREKLRQLLASKTIPAAAPKKTPTPPRIDPQCEERCGRECDEHYRRCLDSTYYPLMCLARRGTCMNFCQPRCTRRP
jgi:hypothetical protein